MAELGRGDPAAQFRPARRAAPGGAAAEVRDVVAAQAVKRVALEFVERRRATWDHRKLGGLY